MLSEESRRIRETLVRDGDPERAPPIEEQRRDWEEAVRAAPLPPGVRLSPDSGGLAGLWAEPEGATPGRAVLLLHGGGFSAGSPVTHREMAARVALAARAPVLVLDYPLAPEHPFPAAVHAAADGYAQLLARGLRPEAVALVGDSAGAALALAALLAARDRGLPAPAACALLSPWLDLAVDAADIEELAERDPLVTPASLRAAARLYLAGADPRDPLASPLRADLRGLPPLLAQVGADEVLLSDSLRLAERARAAGVPLELEVWEHMWHVWHGWAAGLPEGREAIGRVGAFLARHLAPAWATVRRC
jgi:acetyl esterase/lipase